ncbi:unnamed protein product [Mytilus coruscus]|uniref:Uncharacterized protein n=1 Tax=Mytilus coruscus TaxID=42192 RepID=A0A6J8ET96_MYTCO|nr:unnamed protein product [Mytilus coruscus]
MPDTGTCGLPYDFGPYNCACLGPGCAVPEGIPGVKIRNLFRIDEIKTDLKRPAAQYCTNGQFFDLFENICRNVTCFPGRYLKDDKCDPLFPIARNIRYNLGIVITNETGLWNATEQILLRLLEDTVKNHSVGITNLLILKYEQISKSLCFGGPSDSKMITYVAFDLFMKSNINRNDLEQSLLNIAEKSSDKQGMDIHLASSFPELLNSVLVDNDFKNDSHCWKFEENRDYLEQYGRYASTNIQKQIICPQLELDFNQFEIDGSSLLITKHSIKIPNDQFLMDSNNKIRVCVDDFSSFVTKKFLKFSKEYALEITTIVCTCVSLFCLLLTFIT